MTNEVNDIMAKIPGGGWSDPVRGCLATNRRRSHPTFGIDDLGFRLAKSF